MGDYSASKHELDAYNWCVKNNIKISPSASTRDQYPTSWYLIIDIDGRINKSPETYGSLDIWGKLYEYYKYYYNKYLNENKI